ncbi:MAG: MarC family protein [Candidatus Diapherotrites archaeon]
MLQFFLFAFASLFAIVDPIANIPLYNSLLERFAEKEKMEIIRKAVLIALLVLLVFAFAGNYIFALMRISMYSFMIAGGILLFIISIEMLFGLRTRTETSSEEQRSAMDKENIAVTPLAVPLLTGPGAITTAMVVFSQAKTPALAGEFLIAAIGVFLISYVILLRGRKVFSLLGTTGSKTITRIMGLLLAAIAVEFVLNGVSQAAMVLF